MEQFREYEQSQIRGQIDRRALIKLVFNLDRSRQEHWGLDEYFRYYNLEFARTDYGAGQRPSEQHLLEASDLNITAILFTTLKRERASTRPRVHGVVVSEVVGRKGLGATPLQLDLSIDLALRLMLMINVREAKFDLQTPLTPVTQWDNSLTLDSFIVSQFPPASGPISPKDGRLDPYFTAANMVRVCGLKIKWTESLEDHLRLDRRSKILSIFPYKNCLLAYLEGSKMSGEASLLPESVLEETITSLNLLFPHWDEKTEHLLKKENKQSIHQLGPFHGPRSLNLCEFDHWRDRISELYEEVFCSPPVSWAQLWADRRNPQQWYTFWIALFILILTVISTIASLVQAWASIKSLSS